jgi:hypothetical protein
MSRAPGYVSLKYLPKGILPLCRMRRPTEIEPRPARLSMDERWE